MSSGIAQEEGRATGLGLEGWEVRETSRTIAATTVATSFAAVFASLTIGAHWVFLAYAAGAAASLVALRAGHEAVRGSRLRRTLARTCEWNLRLIVFVAMTYAAVQVFVEFMIVPLEPMTGLWDPEVTKTEIAAAVEEGVREVQAVADAWIVLLEVSSVAIGLMSGIADWLWLGALGERLRVSPWRVLFGRGAREDASEVRRWERGCRRRLLRGEA